MKLNTAMRYVIARANAEANASKMPICVEHVFLGLLKLAELSADEVAPTTSHKQELEHDLMQVNARMNKFGIETNKARNLLRRILYEEKNASTGEQEITDILFKAINDEKIITASKVAKVILADPTPMISALFNIKLNKPVPQEVEPKQEELAKKNEMENSTDFLPQLTKKIREMRYSLLNIVHGQDHVIHAFAEGIFSSEVLAASDEKRKRPRSIFVFAGPPGVGKTFLAEQGADALKIPCKRFDMSGYADHQAQVNLVGMNPSYKDAKQGILTGFVKENPHSILIFDEIEKAHLNTIQLFLQILDAGRLKDDFLDEIIAFKDTIIIFTTNAGRQLYEGKLNNNAAGIPRQTILNALETDIHPQTGKPFFPGAICSRLATGYPMMFSHLQAHDLEKICTNEFSRFCALFSKQYNIEVLSDKWLPSTILFAEGGQADARTLRAQTELFFKNEMYKLFRLWDNNLESALNKLRKIKFEFSIDNLSDDVKQLFINKNQSEILIFGNQQFSQKLKASGIQNINIHATCSVDEAFRIIGENDIRFILLELSADTEAPIDLMATVADFDNAELPTGTMQAFDFVPIASNSLTISRNFFKLVLERVPELPIYLLESHRLILDNELLTSFVRAGARGKLVFPDTEDLGVFIEDLERICAQAYLQSAALTLSTQRKVLFFETAPILNQDKSEVTIRIRDVSLRRALSADDGGEVLDDVEKPKVRFSDVIGATEAREELQFFINFLKNPKQFTASGLKPPKGVLLYGPPGTGKTLLAKAMAGESNVAFVPSVASSFVTKWQGSGPEAIRELFKKARRYAPAIIFIDEIDAIGRARGSSGSAHAEEMALNALLTEMDGFTVDIKRPVFVLAATNFEIEEGKGGMGTIDAALARRFDRKILVDLPNKEDRQRYLEMMLGKRKNNSVSTDMISRLAGRSTGLSLANIESVLEMAFRMAAKSNAPVTNELLEEAFELGRHGVVKNWGNDYLERVARHEAGHAYLCFLAGQTPAYLTIVARGNHGGYMEHADDENSPLKTKEQLLAKIRTSLGGRAAEMVYYGREEGISSGASGDLQSATRIARTMICSYGMDDSIGLSVLSNEEATTGPMAEKIHQRVSEIIKEELENTIVTISNGRKYLDKLVEQLLIRNKLTKDEMENILNTNN